jgi:hypothetical protein
MFLSGLAGGHYPDVGSRTIELWVLSVEGQLGQQVIYVFGDQGRISAHALAARRASGQAL